MTNLVQTSGSSPIRLHLSPNTDLVLFQIRQLNLPLYIARRIANNKEGSFSSTIHRIAIVSVTLSLAALIISFFVLFGFKEAIRDKVYNLNGHLTVNKYAISTSYEETSILVTDSLRQLFDSFDEIGHYQSYILKAALIKTDEEVQGIIMKGVGHDFDTARFRSQMISGSFPKLENESYSTEVAVSRHMANKLRLEIGDRATLFFVQDPPRYRRISVSGIYATGMEEFDERIVFGDMAMLSRINGWETDQVGGIEVMLNDHGKMDQMESDLFDQLPIDLNVISANRQYPQIFEWLELLNRNVLILLIVVLIVVILGMISMVLILIMERTRMIGVMKAVGGSDSLVRRVFFFSGLQLLLRGLFFGNLIGLLLCWLQHRFRLIPLDAENYYMDFVPVVFDIPTLVGLNFLLVLFVGLTLFIPILVVSGVRPVEAIRFE